MLMEAVQKDKGTVKSDEWDVICIGTGISSLAFAAQLVAKQPGVRILLLEKHSRAGGYATCFERPEHGLRLDSSLHKLSGMRAGGNLNRILAEIDTDQALQYVYPDHYFSFVTSGETVTLSSDEHQAKAELLAAFPGEAEGIESFFSDVEMYGKDGYFQYQTLLGNYVPDLKAMKYAHKNLKKITVKEKLDELFINNEIKSVLTAPAVYVGAFPEEISYLYYLHVIYATLHKGCAYVIGSSQRLSDHLVEKVQAAGGAIALRTAVTRIIVDAEMNAVGVETTRGKFYASRIYVNAAPKYVMERLIPELPELDGHKKILEKLKNSNSTTTVYLSMSGESENYGLPSIETMIGGKDWEEAVRLRVSSRDAETSDDEQLSEEAYWRAGTMEVTCYQALDPSGGNVVVANVLDSIHHWPKRGTVEYRKKKAHAASVLCKRLYTAIPEIQSHIRSIEVSTPRTYQRYTNNTDGAGYGALVGTDLSGQGFRYDFPIKGIHFLSSWVAGPGYEAAFGYAEIQALSWKK